MSNGTSALCLQERGPARLSLIVTRKSQLDQDRCARGNRGNRGTGISVRVAVPIELADGKGGKKGFAESR